MIYQIEMMSESIDETLDKDEAEEETEELTNQVIINLLYVSFDMLFCDTKRITLFILW